MVSDDLTALAAISMGAVVTAALTLSATTTDVEERTRVTMIEVAAPAAPCPTVGPVIDFAIIRSDPETMVGPEGSGTGWQPARQSLELRLIRGRGVR